MVDLIIVMIGVVLATYLVSRSDIKITVTHNYPQPVDKTVENPTTQEELDKEYNKSKSDTDEVTLEDIIADVQKIIGGPLDD